MYLESIINTDAEAKNRHGWWTGNKQLVNIGLRFGVPSKQRIVSKYCKTLNTRNIATEHYRNDGSSLYMH